MNLADLHPRRFFLETWRDLDEEAAKARAAAGGAYDYRPLIAMVASAVCLTLMEFWGRASVLDRLVRELDPAPDTFLYVLRSGPWWDLAHNAYWALWRVLGYFVLPAIIIKMYGERLRDQGFAVKGTGKHAWIYVASYLVVAGFVLYFASDEQFFGKYPFYRRAGRSWVDLISWELLYVAQFFSLEFFFRGFWLRALGRSMGSSAIFVMMVPYVMIHFNGKPFIETLGAIFAGIFLGTLAMKTRSIWGGFFVHSGVAISMDVAALVQKDQLPTEWLPLL